MPRSAIAFDHIAFGVPSVSDAAPFLVAELGGRPHAGGPGPGYVGGQWRFEAGGCLEVIEPAGPPGGFLHRFLAARGPGIHHVTFKVPALRAAAERARSLGYEVVGYEDSNPGWKECFLHPRQALGIVVQMAESDPALDDSWTSDWSFPPAPTPAPPVRIVGLRLAASSAEAARRQWGSLLGGVCEEPDGDLVFRWPGTPMRVAVTLTQQREEGPRWVELSANRPLALPDGPEPALGATFVQVPDR